MVVEGLEQVLLELPTTSLRKVPSLGSVSTASSSTGSYPSLDCHTPLSSSTPVHDTDNEHETDSEDDHRPGAGKSSRRSSLRGVRKQVLNRRRRFAVTNIFRNNVFPTDVVTKSEPEVAIIYKSRDLLDLFGNVRDPRWNYAPTVLQINNLNQFFDNRSLYHRLSKYGNEDLGMYKHVCRHCQFVSYIETNYF